MSTYTSRTELEDGAVVAWIDRDGFQMIRQPHHPNAFNNEPWASEAEALAWADATIADIEANEARHNNKPNFINRSVNEYFGT